jgi:Tol biopolymer transport system component
LQFGAAGALLAIAIGLGVWRLRPSARPDVIPEPIPFTTSPGFAQFPAFSPDGNQIAFTWAPPRSSAASIYVKQIGSQTELRVTNSSGIDVLPVWSPDGRNIAFYRRLPGRSGYYVVSALGGPERQLVQVDFPAISTSWPYRYFPFAYFWAGIDWFPDGRHVALVLPAEWSENQIIPRNAVDWGARRIVRLDIESGEQVRLTAPPAKSPFGDIEPRISPDGKRLAFVRLATDSVFGIYLLDLSGTAQPRRLTHSDGLYASLDWTPDSRKLIFAAWRNSGNRMWQMAINGGAARPVTSGVENVSSPTVARLGGRLAYALATGHESLWRTPILGSPPSATGLPEPLIESTRLESQPAYSRDGRKLAFASNRSGPPEIWASDADGKHQVQLTNSDALENGTPRWSPDGSAIAFDMRGKGNPSVFVVTVAEHRIRQITHGPAEDAVPSWSKDGRWIYFASNRDGNFQIYKVSALKGESPSSPPVQMTRGGGFNPMESPDGKYLYFAKGLYKRGLLRRSLEAAGEAKEELVLGSLQYWGWWALGPHGVFFLEREAELPNANVHLKFLDLASREITDLRTLENPIYPWNATLAVSPDGRNAVIEELENVGSNIVLIENFR